jgi:proline iminopeptidase
MQRALPVRRSRTTVLLAAFLVSLPCAIVAQEGRQGLLSLEDARIFYEVRGSGDPILVVHGGPGLDHRYLRPGLDVLATRNTLIYYDQRGTGRSTTEVGPETITLEAFVEDIEALREALGYERIHVLTHSFGSRIGLTYAHRYPDRVRSLVLLNPDEPGNRFSAETARRRAEARAEGDSVELTKLTTSEAFEARDPATLGRVFRVAFRATMRDPDRVAELDLDLMDTTARQGQDVAELLGRELGTVDGWTRLSQIEAPALVIHGRYDVTPEAMSRAIAEALPEGRLEVLESGHFPFIEDRDGMLASIAAFLAGLPGR